MTIRLWSLPVDIPWKRMAINDDMYAQSWGGLPPKWRSSIAVYSHDPEPDPAAPEDPDERTTFLKVAVTVTGYQPGPDLSRIRPDGARGASGVAGWKKLDMYYPAYGALLQVTVFPEGGDWRVEQFPYFSDFEPKKREVIELVSDTGEFSTQSTNTLNVRKGSTTTDSTEESHIDGGGSTGVDASVLTVGVGAEKSSNREVGTRSKTSSEGLNVINTDASQEKRETYSHTTNLTQLYELLDSYHVGTNRAVFFLNARPHLIQSPYTFVNGPRRLEGVQEFFLVVRRPKDMERICVKAELETAHLHETQTQRQVGELRYDLKEFTIHQRLDASGGRESYNEEISDRWRIDFPPGYALDSDRGGFSIKDKFGCTQYAPPGTAWTASVRSDSRFFCKAYPRVHAYFDHVEFEATIAGATDNDGYGIYDLTAYCKSIEPVEQPRTEVTRHVDIFLIADQVTSCAGRAASRGHVTFERDVTELVETNLQKAKGGGPGGAAAANAVGRVIRQELARSVASPDRYAAGTVGFDSSRTALRTLIASRDPAGGDDVLHLQVATIAPDALRERLTDGRTTIGDVLADTPERLADRLRLQPHEAADLLLAALRAEASGPGPASRAESGRGGGATPDQ